MFVLTHDVRSRTRVIAAMMLADGGKEERGRVVRQVVDPHVQQSKLDDDPGNAHMNRSGCYHYCIGDDDDSGGRFIQRMAIADHLL